MKQIPDKLIFAELVEFIALDGTPNFFPFSVMEQPNSGLVHFIVEVPSSATIRHTHTHTHTHPVGLL